MTISATAPDASLTAVKPAASASPVLSAIRHRIELNAKATNASVVYAIVFNARMYSQCLGLRPSVCGKALLFRQAIQEFAAPPPRRQSRTKLWEDCTEKRSFSAHRAA